MNKIIELIQIFFEIVLAIILIPCLFVLYPLMVLFVFFSGYNRENLDELKTILMDIIVAFVALIERVYDFIFKIFIK